MIDYTEDADIEYADFDSEDLDERWGDTRGNDYIGAMWDQYSFRGENRHSNDLITAHKMVQSFVNTFARDGYYRVVFDPAIRTAGTDMNAKKIVITPAPVLDPNCDAQKAGLVLTGMATHEICHPRYGKDTSWAVKRAFSQSRAALKLGNLLDDVRIERRFIADYPGYAGVFAPTLEYVAGSAKSQPSVKNQLNLAIAAIRYDQYSTWTPDTEADRRWWQAWAARWAKEDAPRRVIAAVREGLKHIVESRHPAPLSLDESHEQSPDGAPAYEPGDDAQDPQDPQDSQSSVDAGGDAADDEAPASEGPEMSSEPDLTEDEDEKTDEQLGREADESAPFKDDELPICIGAEEVEEAATEGGADQFKIDQMKRVADEQIRMAEDVVDGVDVARSSRGIARRMYSPLAKINPIASRYIRDALMRSRSGHTDVSRYQKRGRLDSHGLHRVAKRDYRVFDRKHAPSPDRIQAWVLIDVSSSMGASAADAASVAMAIADAAQHVPTMRMQVWGWSNSFRGRYTLPGAARVWKTGEPIKDIAKVGDLPQNGTPDAPVLNWAYKAILREVRTGERPVIFMASDGFGYGNLKDVIDRARKAGVQVVSVAIGNISIEHQIEKFGEENVVAWQGSIISTARPLARMIARMVARR